MTATTTTTATTTSHERHSRHNRAHAYFSIVSKTRSQLHHRRHNERRGVVYAAGIVSTLSHWIAAILCRHTRRRHWESCKTTRQLLPLFIHPTSTAEKTKSSAQGTARVTRATRAIYNYLAVNIPQEEEEEKESEAIFATICVSVNWFLVRVCVWVNFNRRCTTPQTLQHKLQQSQQQ